MESALASFVADIKLAVGTRAWDLNMHRMCNAITAAQLTKKNSPDLTEKQGDTNTIISGFQKTRSCVVTWENLREQTNAVRDQTCPAPKRDSITANSAEKKRTKATLPGLTPPQKKGNPLPRGKTGRLSLQLLEGTVNPELTEYASQGDPDFEPYSPPATPQRWQAMTTSVHDHSGDMPQWWPDAAVAATEDSWWLHSVWNTSTTLPVCGHCMWTILVNKDTPYEQLDWAQQTFISLMVNFVNISDDEQNALNIFKEGTSALEGSPCGGGTEDPEYTLRYDRMLDIRCGTIDGVADPNDAEQYGPHHRPPPKFWPRTSLALDMWLLTCHMHDPDYCAWASQPPIFWSQTLRDQDNWRMRQLLGLGYFPPPPKHLLRHNSEESLPRWVPKSIAWQVRWKNLVKNGRGFN